MPRISNDEAKRPFTPSSSSSQNTPPLPKMPPKPNTELDNGDSSPLSLSLRYLSVSSAYSDHSPLIPPPDHFEFSFSSSSFSPDLCYADELFGHGRLLPCKPRHPPAPSSSEMSNTHNTKPLLSPHCRSASLDRATLGHTKRPRLRRASSDSNTLTTAPLRPRWYEVFVLGPRKFPGTVEMREIRSRQRQRAPPPPTTPMQDSASLPWKLLRSLSCKGVESTAAIPIGAPHPPPPLV